MDKTAMEQALIALGAQVADAIEALIQVQLALEELYVQLGE